MSVKITRVRWREKLCSYANIFPGLGAEVPWYSFFLIPSTWNPVLD